MQKIKNIVLSFLILIATFANKVEGQANWVQTSSPPGGSIWDLAVIGTNIFATSTSFIGGVYFSADDGATWIQRNGSFPTMKAYSLAVNGSDLYAGAGPGPDSDAGIYKSSDLGLTWTDITPTGLNPGSAIRSLLIVGTTIFAGTSGATQGIYKSNLAGINSSSWATFNTGLPPVSFSHADIRSLKSNGTNIYAGIYAFGIGYGVWVSPTATANWLSTSLGITAPANWISSLSFNGSNVFAGNVFGAPVLYHSTDNGASWIPSSTSIFNNKGVYALINDGSITYAGTEGAGIVSTSDNGASWRDYNAGFKDPAGNWYCNQINIRSLIFKGGTIYAGTDCGVWKRESAILPATLLSFEAVKGNAGVYLKWKTATESNSDKFEIERSNDGIIYKKIDELKAAGNSTTAKNYNYLDRNTVTEPGIETLFYRLKQFDLDGNYIYSPVSSVKIKQSSTDNYSQVFVYPNPAKDIITIQVDATLVGSNYSIMNATGAKVLDGRINNITTTADISRLGAGVYFIQIGELRKMTFKLTKQ